MPNGPPTDSHNLKSKIEAKNRQMNENSMQKHYQKNVFDAQKRIAKLIRD